MAGERTTRKLFHSEFDRKKKEKKKKKKKKKEPDSEAFFLDCALCW